jgi:transposase
VTVAPANRHDIKQALPTVDRCAPATKPRRLGADKGYDSDKLAAALRQRGIVPYLTPRHWQIMVRHTQPLPPGRPCHQRWKVERTHAWCNQQRRIASFYEKTQRTYDAFVLLACIRFYLRRLHNNALE